MLTLPGRVFSMAQSGSRLVVATSGRHVLIYDLRMCSPFTLGWVRLRWQCGARATVCQCSNACADAQGPAGNGSWLLTRV